MRVGFYSCLGEEKQPVARAWAEWFRSKGHCAGFISPKGGYGRIPTFSDYNKVRCSVRHFDVIICCDIWCLTYLFLTPRIRGIKVYSCFELYSEIIPWNTTVKIERKWIEWLEGRLLRSDWKWVFGNKERLDFYVSKYDAGECYVIPNYPAPITGGNFEVRKSLDSILLVGTVNNRIPVSDLKFVAWYCSQYSIRMVIAGSIQSEFRELENFESVELLPYASGVDYLRLLSQNSLGFAAYVKEGKNYELCAPVKVYDYIFSGMPLLASDQTPLKSLARKTPSMLTYALGDFSSLHQQLDEFRLNWAQYATSAMSAACRFYDSESLYGRGLCEILSLDCNDPFEPLSGQAGA